MVQAHRWGIVSTIKAPAEDILKFAAWHLEQGAAHLFLYLDDDNPEAQTRLAPHPQITVTRTDKAHWKDRLGRVPAKHQLRQCRNAEHAYGQADDLDWLAHIDVDEFLISERPISEILAALPTEVRAARTRPEEVLARDGTHDPAETLCKAWLPPQRRNLAATLYPTWGKHFRGGFLSHVAGKVFARTGQPGIGFRIHDLFENGNRVPSQDIPEVSLIHDHASDWGYWLENYRYRHTKGTYRAELKGALPEDKGGLTPHELLLGIEQAEGEVGLRRFFDEMCVATPELITRLEQHDALRRYRLDLPGKRQKHFPD